MKKFFAVIAALLLLSLGIAVQADVFNMGGTRNADGTWNGLASLETVTVGDPGNAADTAVHSGNYFGQGAVSYTYDIGKYEVTAGQYTAFLNAVAKTDTYGLYNANMWNDGFGCQIQQTGASGSYSYSVASDWANRPVNYVSYWDACRFANWLGNGQKIGDQDATTTERGAYTLDGYTGADGHDIQRNADASWAVTSEDEWYKAAYYKGGGTNAGYWFYPTQSNTTPSNQLVNPTDPGNNATFYSSGYTMDGSYYRTEVGAHENSDSAYGTFDQGGNMWEWNEGLPSGVSRGLRGGAFYFNDSSMQSMTRYYGSSGLEGNHIGFRVTQVVPEPSSLIASLGGLAGLIGLRRRRR